MPKKTKKEKILSEQRRKNSLVNTFRQTVPLPFPIQSLPTQIDPLNELEQKPDYNSSAKTLTGDKTDISIISRSLIKTVILGILAIGLEFGLYWYSQIKT